jgi:hypothetical protein
MSALEMHRNNAKKVKNSNNRSLITANITDENESISKVKKTRKSQTYKQKKKTSPTIFTPSSTIAQITEFPPIDAYFSDRSQTKNAKIDDSLVFVKDKVIKQSEIQEFVLKNWLKKKVKVFHPHSHKKNKTNNSVSDGWFGKISPERKKIKNNLKAKKNSKTPKPIAPYIPAIDAGSPPRFVSSTFSSLLKAAGIKDAIPVMTDEPKELEPVKPVIQSLGGVSFDKMLPRFKNYSKSTKDSQIIPVREDARFIAHTASSSFKKIAKEEKKFDNSKSRLKNSPENDISINNDNIKPNVDSQPVQEIPSPSATDIYTKLDIIKPAILDSSSLNKVTGATEVYNKPIQLVKSSFAVKPALVFEADSDLSDDISSSSGDISDSDSSYSSSN